MSLLQQRLNQGAANAGVAVSIDSVTLLLISEIGCDGHWTRLVLGDD